MLGALKYKIDHKLLGVYFNLPLNLVPVYNDGWMEGRVKRNVQRLGHC